MDDFDKLLNEQLKDEEFKKEWLASEEEYTIITAMIKARMNQQLTQKELASKIGMKQADISKFESGNANPTLQTLQRLADGLNMNLKLDLIPK